MYDVAVIGSGYGGSVIAARLSKDTRVLLVERGKRWQSGDFPHSLTDLARSYITRKNPLGLWAMRLGPGTGNALASGFGGASLINYGITQKPDDHVFDHRWPFSAADLAPYFERARSVLRPSPNPIANTLADRAFFDHIEPGRRVDLENTIDWNACTQCGRCCPGCNLNAKLSLDRTYLALAEQNGAEMRLETELVHFALQADGSWKLSLRPTAGGAVETLRARQLVLACGTFGTLDLLHRLRRELPTTDLFGQQMTMNGDGLAFLYNTEQPLSTEHGAPISTSVRLPFTDATGDTRMLAVMGGRLPFSIINLAGGLMALLGGNLLGKAVGPLGPPGGRAWRRLRDLAGICQGGALSQTLMYKLDAEDSASGRAIFDNQGHAAVNWPNYADDPIMVFAAQQLEQWAERVGGVLIRDVATLPGFRSFGVHALGGCNLGTNPNDGVVDEEFRLMKSDGSVYPGLRVVDASVISSALGVPSSFTISALAERAAESIQRELGSKSAS